MTTRISDVVVPEVFADYINEDLAEKTAFYDSGVVVRNELLDANANVGGTKIEVPFWQDLPNDEANISNDDPNDKATGKKVTASKMTAHIANLNQGWSTMDLTGALAGSKPAERIRNRVSPYWAKQFQRRAIQTSVGVLADNVANDSGDMVYNIATDAAGAITSAEQFSRTAFIRSAMTLGDAFENTGALAVHSAVYTTMLEQGDVEDVRDDQGTLLYRSYMGHRLIVDDGCPAVAGTNRITYTSILFGAGALGYGMGSAEVPVEVAREASAGNGGGQETLWTRQRYILHPGGFEFTGSPAEDGGATLAELAAATSWDRKYERKNIPMAFLQTNG